MVEQCSALLCSGAVGMNMALQGHWECVCFGHLHRLRKLQWLTVHSVTS